MYNEHHRKGKPSQYTWENVAIVPGGRAGLIRIAAVLNQAYLGFFIPDYTAYNEMLSLFRNVSGEIPPKHMAGCMEQEHEQADTLWLRCLVRCYPRSSARGGWIPHSPWYARSQFQSHLYQSQTLTLSPDKIAEEISRGTGVILTSNPRNPTGRVVQNPELAEIQDICRGRSTFISDEF